MPPFKALSVICTLCLFSFLVTTANAGDLTDGQKKEVEAIVRELITKKEPELIIKAAQTVQEKMESEAATKGQQSVEKNLNKIINDSDAPVGGNAKGDVTVVEFFDYSCGYCKLAQENLEKLLSDDKNIRLIYKELPILGQNSLTASKAALASVSQGGYLKFHEALMKSKSPLNESAVMDVAKETGLDTEKLKKDMESEKIAKMLKSNIALAKEIGAQGTPTFIIGGKLYPGAVPYEQMKEAVEAARKTKKK